MNTIQKCIMEQKRKEKKNVNTIGSRELFSYLTGPLKKKKGVRKT